MLEVVIIIDNLDNNLDIDKEAGGGGDNVDRDDDDIECNQEVDNDDDFVDKIDNDLQFIKNAKI